MLKKLLKGCLAIAMIGAFATSASAEASMSWTGNATGYFAMYNATNASGDGISYMDMGSSYDIDFKATVEGDAWNGTAKIEFDGDASSIGVDDVYAEMSNESLAILIGENDVFGIGKGDDYLGEFDQTYGAGGVVAYSVMETVSEQGLVQVSLKDMNLNVIVAMNGDANLQETLFGANYDMDMGDMSLAVAYYSFSSAASDTDLSIYVDGDLDGASGSEMALAFQYAMGEMAFTLNYTSAAITGNVADEVSGSVMEFLFDMGMGDNGLTVAYAMESKDDGTVVTDTTLIQAGYMMKMGGVSNYFDYYTKVIAKDDDSDDDESGAISYAMKVSF